MDCSRTWGRGTSFGDAAGLAHYGKSDRYGVSGLPFLPHKTTGEGLFLAVLRKTADEPR